MKKILFSMVYEPVVVNARRAPPESNTQRRNTFLTLLAAATALGLLSSSFADLPLAALAVR